MTEHDVTAAGGSDVTTARHGETLVITINRQEVLNALDVPAMKAIRAALLELDQERDLAVGILTGAGTRAFCVGADLKATLPPTIPFASAYFQPYEQSIDSGLYVRAIALDALRLSKPLIAAVNGHCLGGGMEMALACDLRVASGSATFGLPEPKIGSIPAIGGSSLLMRAVPSAVAMKMLLTGDRIDAEEAYRLGLVSDMVASDDLMPTALALAERIAANSPLAVQAVKEIARSSADLPLTQAIRNEQLYWGILRDTEDRIEGRTAFAEKRPPRWSGR